MSLTTYRWCLYALSGIVLLAFGASALARGYRRHHAGTDEHWPLPWECLTGLFLLSVAAVQLTDATRIAVDQPRLWEYRASAIALTFCAVMSVWLFARWRRDEEDA